MISPALHTAHCLSTESIDCAEREVPRVSCLQHRFLHCSLGAVILIFMRSSLATASFCSRVRYDDIDSSADWRPLARCLLFSIVILLALARHVTHSAFKTRRQFFSSFVNFKRFRTQPEGDSKTLLHRNLLQFISVLKMAALSPAC